MLDVETPVEVNTDQKQTLVYSTANRVKNLRGKSWTSKMYQVSLHIVISFSAKVLKCHNYRHFHHIGRQPP